MIVGYFRVPSKRGGSVYVLVNGSGNIRYLDNTEWTRFKEQYTKSKSKEKTKGKSKGKRKENESKRGTLKLLGGQKELNRHLEWMMIRQMSLYTRPSKQKGGTMSLYGRNGFFGEVSGACGFGNSPSCCFSECAPMWRTPVWPLDFAM